MGSTGHYLGLRPGLILVEQFILVHGLLPGLMLHELAASLDEYCYLGQRLLTMGVAF